MLQIMAGEGFVFLVEVFGEKDIGRLRKCCRILARPTL